MSNKLTKTAQDQMIIDALGTQLKATTTITLGGTAYKAKDLQQQLQAEVDAAKVTQSAKTAYAQAVLAEQKGATQAALLRKALRSYLIGVYGAKSSTVAAFGFTPKATTVDVATKAVAIEKREATRVARGTMGPKQKKGIKGTVPATSAATPPGAAASAPVVPAVNSVTPKSATPS